MREEAHLEPDLHEHDETHWYPSSLFEGEGGEHGKKQMVHVGLRYQYTDGLRRIVLQRRIQYTENSSGI